MTNSTRSFIVLSAVLAAGLAVSARQSAPPPPLAPLVLPAGFRAEVFAEKVENARSLALGPQGTVFVGSQYAGKVHAVVDRDGDHKADRVVVIASGLDQPNGVAMRNGALYVATASRLLRFDDIEKHLDAPPAPVTVRADLPNPKAGHTWKFIAFGPDDLLYMSVGSTCNVCAPAPMTAAIVRMKPDGSGMEVFAEGVRNSVGFDWHPVTRELWFTDNGRDGLGDDVPDDELNVAPKAGLHFGFPFCHQGDVADPDFGAERACSTAEPPVQKLGAHVAAIGFTFYTGNMFPASYKNAAIIAQHGSWNRSTPSGYRVMVAHTEGRRVTGYALLLDGFLPDAKAAGGRGATGAATGRPADVLQLPDGSILVSDDRGRLIRVSYGPPLVRAQGRTEITINDTGVQAENLTSSQDGSVYFGSTAKGTIYRAAPGAAQAEPWIQAATAGLTNVLGVLADDKTNTLWVCQNNTGGRGGAPVVGQTALRSFDLKSGAAKGTYPFPTNGGVCNDMAVAADGTVYATESFANRIHRLKPGAKELDLWVPADQRLAGVDGIAILADGAVYVNTFFAGLLFRIPVNPDGGAGAMVPIELSMPLTRPDGLRTVGPRTLIQAEGQGRLTELTINGNRAEVRVLREGLNAATGVTLVGNTAFVLVDRARGVGVPYQPGGPRQSGSGARPEAVADGKRLYDANCASCHGPRAEGAVKAGIAISIIEQQGGKQPPDLTDAASDHGSTEAEMLAVIKKGIPSGMMAPYEGRLSEVEVRNVVAYVRSLSASPAPTTAAAPVRQSTARTLEVADYVELPVTGDKSTNLISGQLARGSILRDEPGGQRFFVTDLNGPLYILNKQRKQLTPYLNFDGTGDRAGLFPKFTAAQGFAAGLMNFVFDPDYTRNGIFYTLHMENPNTPGESAAPKTGVVPGLNLAGYTTTPALPTPIVTNVMSTRDMVIVEWTDRQIGNTTFEGTAREVLRLKLPGLFHPLNEITFNPAARPGDPDWRVMYLGVGDSGTGERPGPMRLHAQRLDTLHGKILRIIPMLSEHASTSTVSENGRYRIPNDNPFVSIEGARKEVWALGLRNPHRLTWYVDSARPREAVLLAFNIGLVSWETVMVIKKGANYGYPLREGAQSMSATNGMGPLPEDDVIPVQLSDTVTRGTVKPTYPVAAYPHTAAAGGDAIANGFAYRGKRIPALQGTLVFGDITTGRIWYAQMKEVLAADDGNPLTLAPLHELDAGLRRLTEDTFRKRGGQGDSLPGFGAVAGRGRVDIRLAEDNEGELYILTKADGMIREVRAVR